MLREARGGLKATVGNGVKSDYHFIHIVFCPFLFLSARFLCSLAGYAQSMSAHIGHCGPKPGRGLKNIFKLVQQSLLLFHENKPNDNKGISKHLRFCWQQLFGPLHNITEVCTISFERPVNYLYDAWHVFPPKYEAWTHFSN